jgi:ArsR family transcriptional regulator
MATKEGNTVVYSIASPVITELLAVARRALTGLLSDQVALLDDLRAGR